MVGASKNHAGWRATLRIRQGQTPVTTCSFTVKAHAEMAYDMLLFWKGDALPEQFNHEFSKYPKSITERVARCYTRSDIQRAIVDLRAQGEFEAFHSQLEAGHSDVRTELAQLKRDVQKIIDENRMLRQRCETLEASLDTVRACSGSYDVPCVSSTRFIDCNF